MLKFCKNCQANKNKCCPSGYSYWWKESVRICPNCKGELIDIDFPTQDGKIIIEISEEPNFIEAMIKLRKDNIIEYESRMSQFRAQVAQMEQIERQQEESSQIRCPYCQSKNINKITGLSKASSVVLWGIFAAGKVSKNYHCNNCKSDF